MLNLPIDIDDIFVLIKLLYPRILLLRLHIIWFLINSAVAATIIIITLDLRLLDSWALIGPIARGVHRALFLPVVQEIRLVRDGTFVGLRSVVQDGVGHVLEKRWSHQLSTLLARVGSLFTPHYHLFFALLDTWAAWEEGKLHILLRLLEGIGSTSYTPLVLGDLVAGGVDRSNRSNWSHCVFKLLLRAICLIGHISVSISKFKGSIWLIKFESEFLVDDMSLFRQLPICFRALLGKRFIVGGTISVVRHYLRGTQSITVLHTVSWVVVALYELSASSRNSILILLLRTLAQPGASGRKIGLVLTCLNRVERVLDLFLLAVYPLRVVHIAVIILLGATYNGISTSSPIFVVHLSYLVGRCYIWQFNEIFKEPLMILTLIADSSKLFGFTLLHSFLSWVLTHSTWIEQNTICIGKKLFISIRCIVSISEPLFFHGDL